MYCLVTGGAGFIGSHLIEHLLASGHKVLALDNLSTGHLEFLRTVQAHPQFELRRFDLYLQRPELEEAMTNVDMVFHLAANADVRFGTHHPERDVQQNTLVTSYVLEAMRKKGVQRIAFSSTGSVYGEPDVFPTPENAPFPLQTSLYGASKAACEALISAYCHGFGFHGYVFRFVSVLGERYSHGHVFDFCKQLIQDPTRLKVLGDGTQTKSYMYVGDCIKGIMTGVEKGGDGINIFNLGSDETCQVRDSIGWIAKKLKLSPAIEYGGGKRGWIGDSPLIHLDCGRMAKLGWRATTDIRTGIEKTVEYLQANQWILERE